MSCLQHLVRFIVTQFLIEGCELRTVSVAFQIPFQLYHMDMKKVRKFMKPLQIGVLGEETWSNERDRKLDEDFYKLWEKCKEMVQQPHSTGSRVCARDVCMCCVCCRACSNQMCLCIFCCSLKSSSTRLLATGSSRATEPAGFPSSRPPSSSERPGCELQFKLIHSAVWPVSAAFCHVLGGDINFFQSTLQNRRLYNL